MDDFDILASRALKPFFYRAHAPGNRNPYDYQHAAVEYCLNRNNALIGDAPGTGKTCETILLSNAINAEKTLVVCPASLILNWEREIWMWSTAQDQGHLTYPVKKPIDGIPPDRRYVIMSYDRLRNKGIFAAVMAMRWDHMILDEAHYIKDPKGNLRTKPICGWMDKGTYVPGLVDVVGRITLATGTPTPNQPIEIYNSIRLLDHSAIDYASLEDFRTAYYAIGEGFVNRRVWDEKTKRYVYKRVWSNNVRNQPINLDDLQYRLRKHIMVRRLKEDVLPQLPPKQWHPFPLVTDAAMRTAAKHPGWAAAEKLYEMDPDAFDTSIPVDGAISTARRVMGEAKAPAVASYIEELIAEGTQKIVVATWHNSVIDYMTERLKKHNLVRMDGRMSINKKQAVVDQFQLDPRVTIIIGQMRVLGLGWTLTVAQDVVFAEFDYVPGNNDQFLDRIHRVGQEGGYVLGHVPMVPGTLEEKIMGGAIKKDKSIYRSLDEV